VARRPNPKIKASDDLTQADYTAIFGDPDGDGIPTVDDPRPTIPGDTTTVEEVHLSEEIGQLLSDRKHWEKAEAGLVKNLKKIGSPYPILSRSKTPFSVINKLRRKRLITLTDLAGAMIIAKDRKDMDRIVRALGAKKGDPTVWEPTKKDQRTGKAGKVLEIVDHYRLPGPYKAIHFIIEATVMTISKNGKVVPVKGGVEIQVKTKRQKKIAGINHPYYKRGTQVDDKFMATTDMIARADKGDKKALATYKKAEKEGRLVALIGHPEDMGRKKNPSETDEAFGPGDVANERIGNPYMDDGIIASTKGKFVLGIVKGYYYLEDKYGGYRRIEPQGAFNIFNKAKNKYVNAKDAFPDWIRKSNPGNPRMKKRKKTWTVRILSKSNRWKTATTHTSRRAANEAYATASNGYYGAIFYGARMVKSNYKPARVPGMCRRR